MKYKAPEMEILILETHDVVTFSTGEANYNDQGQVDSEGNGSETAPDGF